MWIWYNCFGISWDNLPDKSEVIEIKKIDRTDVSNPTIYGISHFVSFKRVDTNDTMMMKGGFNMNQIKMGSFLEPVHIKIASKIIAKVRFPKYRTSSLS